MAVKENEKPCFTFLWMLENVSGCLEKKGEAIESPAFVVDEIHETKWRLSLYPRGKENGNYVGCFLKRESDSKGEDSVEIKYELAFISNNRLVSKSYGITLNSFRKGEDNGYSEFEKRRQLFVHDRFRLLSNDLLRVRCRIWKNLGDVRKEVEEVQCCARTRIGVERRSFVWNLENFCSLESGKECTYLIRSLNKDRELMSVTLSIAGGQNSDEIIHFKLTRHDPNIKYCGFRLCLVHFCKRLVECNEDEFWFDRLCDTQRITFLFSREDMFENLPFGILSLQWEWFLSKGVVSEEIEEVKCGYIVNKLYVPLGGGITKRSIIE